MVELEITEIEHKIKMNSKSNRKWTFGNNGLKMFVFRPKNAQNGDSSNGS